MLKLTALWLIGTLMLLSPIAASADNLRADTLQRWDEYVKEVEARNQRRVTLEQSFLWTDEVQGQAQKLRGGDIVVIPAAPHIPLSVPSGLIHDWIAAAFIPRVTLPDILSVVRDYGRYKEFYSPNVANSVPLTTSEWEDRFSLMLVNRSVIAQTALDGDYRSSYRHIDDLRWYSVTASTRMQEVADYGTSSQHMLPENQGTGYMWREFSITRFEERDGGVYVELEAVVLSRDVPLLLRWLVDPIVRRMSQSSLETSLTKTRNAVRSTADKSRG